MVGLLRSAEDLIISKNQRYHLNETYTCEQFKREPVIGACLHNGYIIYNRFFFFF